MVGLGIIDCSIVRNFTVITSFGFVTSGADGILNSLDDMKQVYVNYDVCRCIILSKLLAGGATYEPQLSQANSLIGTLT